MSFGSLLFSVFGFQGTSRRLPGYGDGEIRTLDPLLARQVLSQLSYAPIFHSLFSFFLIRQPPALPYRLQYSTIGRLSLNHRVRDGMEPAFHGCLP